MATQDVPGANPDNGDELHAGCWAEHDDGSLIFVEGAEGGNVVYSVFDMSKDPIVEYRDSMSEKSFKSTFSAKGKVKDKWTWHDKTHFPWDRVIKKGFSDGPRHVSAEALLTAAERVAQSLRLRGKEVADDLRHRSEDVRARAETNVQGLLARIGRTIDEFLEK
jgi:hypothetical protein